MNLLDVLFHSIELLPGLYGFLRRCSASFDSFHRPFFDMVEFRTPGESGLACQVEILFVVAVFSELIVKHPSSEKGTVTFPNYGEL